MPIIKSAKKRVRTAKRMSIENARTKKNLRTSTNKNYVNAEGKKGSYMDFAKVFRRENLPCPRCNTIIVKTKVAGRGTHTCPKCQIQPS